MTKVVTGETEFFKSIEQVKFEGLQSDNPMAFRWYDANQVVAGKTMNEHFKFACAYWHSFNGNGADPFGGATHIFPWDEKKDAPETIQGDFSAIPEATAPPEIPVK